MINLPLLLLLELTSEDLNVTIIGWVSLNPTFGADMNSSFVFDTTETELKDNKGLVFKVKDWDRIGSNDELGQVTVAPETLLQATAGEDMELPITPPTGRETEKAGFITLRCRPATEEDRKPKSGLLQRFGLKGGEWMLMAFINCLGFPPLSHFDAPPDFL